MTSPKPTSELFKDAVAFDVENTYARIHEWYGARDSGLIFRGAEEAYTRLRPLLEQAHKCIEALEWYADEKNLNEDTGSHGKYVREPNTVDGPGETYWDLDYGILADKALASLRDIINKEASGKE